MDEKEEDTEKEEKSETPEKFAAVVLGILSTNSNSIIKELRWEIENCLKDVSGLNYKDGQKKILNELLINIITGTPFNEIQKNAFNSKYSVKKFLRKKEEFYFSNALMDLVYSCYDLYRKELSGYTAYIDKISDYINKG